jgi:hypothetical protein
MQGTRAMDDRNPTNTSEVAPVKNATEARAGVTGHNVRYVLVFGLGAAVLFLGVVLLAFFKA